MKPHCNLHCTCLTRSPYDVCALACVRLHSSHCVAPYLGHPNFARPMLMVTMMVMAMLVRFIHDHDDDDDGDHDFDGDDYHDEVDNHDDEEKLCLHTEMLGSQR